jgi:hypothetical protein
VWATLIFALLALGARPGRRTPPWWSVVAIGLTSLLNLFSQLLYSIRTGTGFGEYTIIFDHRFLSTNSLIHTHVFKSMIALAMKGLGMNPGSIRADSGTPFLSVIPAPLAVAGLCLTLLAIVLTCGALLGKAERWSGRHAGPFWIGLIISSYAVLKCLVDGGPFSAEFLVYFPPFVCLLLTDPPSPKAVIRAAVPWWVLGLYLDLALYVWADVRLPGDLLLDVALLALFFSTLLLSAGAIAGGRAAAGRAHLFWIVPLLALSVWMRDLRFEAFKYFPVRLQPGKEMLISDYFGFGYPMEVKYSEGRMKIYSMSVTEPTSIWSIYRRLGIPPNYVNFNIPGKTCSTRRPFIKAGTIKLLSHRKPWVPSPSPMFESLLLTPCRADERCDYRYEAAIKGCIPDNFSETVFNHLNETGWDNLVMTTDDIDLR